MAPWVRTPGQLAQLLASLRGCRAIALDSESDSLHHYREKVCLLQVASDRGESWLVDPLAIRDLGGLAPHMAAEGLLKVLHGADYDVVTLKRDFGFSFTNLFDTMIAARFLGLPAVGLQALARQELGVELSKDSQKDDWSRRPLSPRQEQYALDDVRHLLALQQLLSERLRSLERVTWVEEECEAVARLPPARRAGEPQPDAFLRIKGARRLGPRALAVLRELVAWREHVAAARDVPVFRVLGSDQLLELAARPPRTLTDLARPRGVLPRLRDQAPRLLEAVERALALPDAALPRFPPAPRPIVPEATRARVQALRAWRTQAAEHAKLDVSLVLPQRLLDKVAESRPRSTAELAEIDSIRRWRVAAFGAGMLAALDQAGRQ